MNFIKHIEARYRRHHRQEAAARGIRALSRLVRRSLLLRACFAIAALMALADVGIAQAAPPDATPIAEIRLLRKANVGDDVRLVSTGRNDPQVHFSWKLDRQPKLSKAKISDHNSAATSFRADVPGHTSSS
ncbi:MAG TPA: hypothetical protein VGK44_01755 [Casimicrobiaceae bacterium]|jgi:hypothetical protein